MGGKCRISGTSGRLISLVSNNLRGSGHAREFLPRCFVMPVPLLRHACPVWASAASGGGAAAGGEGVPFGPVTGPRGTKMGVFDALGPAIGPKGTLKLGKTPGVTHLQGGGRDRRVLEGKWGCKYVEGRNGKENRFSEAAFFRRSQENGSLCDRFLRCHGSSWGRGGWAEWKCWKSGTSGDIISLVSNDLRGSGHVCGLGEEKQKELFF